MRRIVAGLPSSASKMPRKSSRWNASNSPSLALRVSALSMSRIIDTTTGRRSGQQRRIEIFLHDEDGRLFITGMPRADRTRDWIHNIQADPHVVLHLKQSVTADLPATARVVTDPDERLPLIEAAARRWQRTDVPVMMEHSPLIVLDVDGE